jgi:hypothetical protein
VSPVTKSANLWPLPLGAAGIGLTGAAVSQRSSDRARRRFDEPRRGVGLANHDEV